MGSNGIGKKIKIFRQRAGMSQMDLEMGINGAAGMVSRIESGKVNPSKETVLEIGKVLELNNMEIDYMIGPTAEPAMEEEMEKAKEEAKDLLTKKGSIGYLLDDRWRFVAFSDTFNKFVKMTPEDMRFMIGRTTAQTIVEEGSPALTWVDEKHRTELLHEYLPQFYSRMSYFKGDEIYENTVRLIMNNPAAKKIWTSLEKERTRENTPEEKRVIHFEVLGIKIPLYYVGMDLVKNSRFVWVEFYTENKILNLLSKLV